MTNTDSAFPSHVAPSKHIVAKPFGQNEHHRLRNKEEALRTLSRQQCFDKGYISVKDLDDEELRYGRCRDENGLIPQRNGRKTELLPQDKFDEMIAEHELRYKQKLRQRTDDMLDIMTNIAQDDTVEPRDRFEAAKYLFERTAGKTPETVNVTVQQAPWEGLLNNITGIGSISRAEHRRITEEGDNAGIIDVEYEDEDVNPVSPEDISNTSAPAAEQDVVSVHQPRPAEPDPAEAPQAQPTQPTHYKAVDGEPTFAADPAQTPPDRPSPPVEPDQYEQYGSRRTESKSYADQVRDAEALAKRRKESKEKIRNAKKQRIINRTMGADAIKDEITGANLDENGNLRFE